MIPMLSETLNSKSEICKVINFPFRDKSSSNIKRYKPYSLCLLFVSHFFRQLSRNENSEKLSLVKINFCYLQGGFFIKKVYFFQRKIRGSEREKEK